MFHLSVVALSLFAWMSFLILKKKKETGVNLTRTLHFSSSTRAGYSTRGHGHSDLETYFWPKTFTFFKMLPSLTLGHVILDTSI